MESGGFFSDFFEKVKESFNNFDLESSLRNLGQSPMGTAIVCFAGSFATGFLFKRYFKFVLGTIFLSGAIVMYMHYKHLIVIDIAATKMFLGFDPELITVSTVFQTALEWTRTNLLVFVPSVFGFILGYKLG